MHEDLWDKVISSQDDGIAFWVKASPQAMKNEVIGVELVGELQYAMKIKVKAKPVDGAANEALLKFLAEVFDVKNSAVMLISGHTAKMKRFRCLGVSREEAIAKLMAI
jgi:uncharacterized protein (TIGR00251 family)